MFDLQRVERRTDVLMSTSATHLDTVVFHLGDAEELNSVSYNGLTMAGQSGIEGG